MAKWIRFEQDGKTGFGTLEGDSDRRSCRRYVRRRETDRRDAQALRAFSVLTPCEPSKMICLWNNFHQLAAKNDFTEPKEPLWFLKAPNAYLARQPADRAPGHLCRKDHL